MRLKEELAGTEAARLQVLHLLPSRRPRQGRALLEATHGEAGQGSAAGTRPSSGACGTAGAWTPRPAGAPHPCRAGPGREHPWPAWRPDRVLSRRRGRGGSRGRCPCC